MSQDSQNKPFHPGPIALFGSGETSTRGRKVHEYMFHRLPPSPKVALLETPAGFELNSDKVIERVGEFLNHRLQNFDPRIEIVPARKRGTYHSPDNPDILKPLMGANLIFMGPGSPTYAVRQLQHSRAWQMLIAHHCMGGAITLASAATIAISSQSLPVYEIYKVGEDPHWKEGLDLFGLYGLNLVFVPHWNNNDGGEELDTSRCFMGLSRFNTLINMLPPNTIIIGIDELTGLIIDPASGECRVIGKGGVTLLRTSMVNTGLNLTETEINRSHGELSRFYQDGETFPLNEIGSFNPFNPEVVLPSALWMQMLSVKLSADNDEKPPPESVNQLVNERERARDLKDWKTADELRNKIADMGWSVMDTPDGPQLNKNK